MLVPTLPHPWLGRALAVPLLALAAGCASAPPDETAPPASAAVTAGGAPPALSLPPPPPEGPPAPVTAEQAAAFRNYLSRARTEAAIPGLAAVIVQPGRVLLLEAFGTRVAAPAALGDLLAPKITLDTRFALGPASQAVNSLLVARLAQQGFVGPNAAARRCWDDFKLADDAATRTVTLRDLLSMTAGVPEYADKLLRPPHDTPGDLFAVLAQIPVLAQPGMEYNFSAASAAAGGYLATLAAFRQSENQKLASAQLPGAYAALAHNQVFVPAGMARATFAAPAAASDADEALGHVLADGAYVPASTLASVSGGALTPAEGLRASARDVAAWLQVELSGGVTAGGERLLGEALVRERWRPESPRAARQYALGWRRQYDRGLELIVQTGEHEGQSVLIVIVPRYQTAAAVLVNAASPRVAVLLQDVLFNLCDLLRETAGETTNLLREAPSAPAATVVPAPK